MLQDLVSEGRKHLGCGPVWHRPDTKTRQGELNEIERTSRSLEIPLDKLKTAVEAGKMGPLTKLQWRLLKNSHSWGITEKKAREHAEKKGRDIDKIYKGIEDCASMPAPIVLHRKGHRPYLMAGNHRLMAAYTKGIVPDVLHIYLDEATAS
jgi:hypothetical protein